MTVELSLDVAE